MIQIWLYKIFRVLISQKEILKWVKQKEFNIKFLIWEHDIYFTIYKLFTYYKLNQFRLRTKGVFQICLV